MKKCLVLLLVISMLHTLPGCGPGAVPDEPAAPAVSGKPTAAEAPAEAAAPADPAAVPEPTPEPTPEPVPVTTEVPAPAEDTPDAVDVDLTLLSSTMVYSEVYAMLYEPEQYDGKTVKMSGLFATQEYNGKRLYACIVQDATACCSQGLEFEMADEFRYPDDYPEPGAEITVVGTFDSYKEETDGNYYIYLVLRNARFV